MQYQGDNLHFEKPDIDVDTALQGCKAIICMPIVSPEIKVRAVQRLGGIVELVGETYTETQAHAQVGCRV